MRRWLWIVVLGLMLGALPRARAKDEPKRRVVAYVQVRGDGHVRIPLSALRALGVKSARELRVERRGESVPVCDTGADGDLLFLALDTAGPHTATAVYELIAESSAAERAPILQQAAAARRAGAAALMRRHVDAEDRVYGAVSGGRTVIYQPQAPTWFLLRLEHEGRVQRALDGSGAEGPQTLRALVHGTYVGPIAVAAEWGDLDLGLAKAENAAGRAWLTWRVPAGAAPAARTPLVLVNRSPPLPPEPRNDLSPDRGRLWIDRLELVGAHVPTTNAQLGIYDIGDNATAWIHLAGAASARGGACTAWVLDDEGSAIAASVLARQARDSPGIRLDKLGGGARLVLTGGALRSELVRFRAPTQPLQTVGDARHLIIAVPKLVAAARALAAHRTKQGLPSAVVDVTDIYAIYGHGEQTPEAIHAFLRAVRKRETPLEYLLLAGDAIHDRTDWSARAMIPVPMARTLWNGATPSDRLYVGDDGGPDTGATAVGRLPFRTSDEMKRYVNRLIAHETQPLGNERRRLLRFLAGEPGMGEPLDTLFERAFRLILEQELHHAFEVEVTYGRTTSPYYWPLHSLNEKIVTDLNDGCLVYTFIGHGTSHESEVPSAWDADMGVFTPSEVANIDIQGPQPLMLVLASTGAAFDLPKRDGLGEGLLRRHRGPLAYWGATRYCNPVYNVLVARGLAMGMHQADRVGDLLAIARAELHTSNKSGWHKVVMGNARRVWPDVPEEAILREGTATYALLGDPALRFMRPRTDVAIEAKPTDTTIAVTVRCPLPDGTRMQVHLVRRRNDSKAEPKPASNPGDPGSFDTVKAIHGRVNDRALVRGTLALQGGVGNVTLTLPEGRQASGLRVVAYAVTENDVLHGALVLE